MIDDVGDGWATPETARRARETRELDDSTLSLSQRRLNYGDASDGPSDEELEYGGHGFGSSLVESMVESAKAPTLSRGVHLCAVLAASVARCDLVSACYAGCFLTLSGSTRPTAKDIARSKRTSWMSLLIGLAFIAAQVTFQSTAAAMSRVPASWLRAVGLRTFNSGKVGARSLIPDALVVLTSVWAKNEFNREMRVLEEGGEPQSTAVANTLRRILTWLLGLTDEELRKSAQKWWRLLGFLCCAIAGYSANGIIQFLLFLSVHTRLVGGRGDVRTSRFTRFQHAVSTTGKMQLLSGLIIIGSYLFTSLKSVSQILEDSKVPNMIGFWNLGRDGRVCCMSSSQTVGFVFLLLANVFFAVAISYGDADTAFEFNELAGFEIKTHLYRPLLYTPIVGALMTFSGLANIDGLPTNLIQVVDVVTMLFTFTWMLASARNLETTRRNVEVNFQDKWLVRLRDVLGRYVAFQYCYISILYLYNIPRVAEEVLNSWPVSLRRNLTPYDFGLFQTSALNSWRLMYPRYLCVIFSVMLHYWLEERLRQGAAELDGFASEDDVDIAGEITPERKPNDDTGEQMTSDTQSCQTMRPSMFLYHACATVFVHVRNSLGDQFESQLHASSMELLLLVAIICVAFRIEVLSVVYVVVIMFASIELAVPTLRGKAPLPLHYGWLRVPATMFRILSDAWRYLNRIRKGKRNVITAADVTSPGTLQRQRSRWFHRDLRESDYRHGLPLSIHTEVNDYSFYLALIAALSITSKQITLLSVFQSGSLNTVVNRNWGSWLGLLSLYDPRLGDDLETTRTCCAWPYELDSTGAFCYDPQLAMSTANQFPVRACLNFTTNWYIFGAQYAVIIFAALHGYLQRRHNVKMQEKAKAATARSIPRASYWAKLRGEVRGSYLRAKLKLLIAENRVANADKPRVKKPVIASTDSGMSPIVQHTPIRAEDDLFASFHDELAASKAVPKSRSELLGWRQFVIRLVYRFVHHDLRYTFETFEQALDKVASVKYLLAMGVLLINAFLKSDVTSSIYILMLGYFLAFNNRSGVVRFQSQGYAILLIIGAILMVHILAALRLPPSWLGTDYCETCPEKRFWLNIWDCPHSNSSLPTSSSSSSPYLACNSRPVFVHEYEIISDILVMLLVAHYVRKGHKNMVSDDVRTAWMRGYMKAKGKQLGDEWVHSTAFVSLADKVNARLAQRRQSDATTELSFSDKIKKWDTLAMELKSYEPSVEGELRREETKRAVHASRKLENDLLAQKEKEILDKSYNFGDIVQLVVKDRVVKAHSITAEDMGRYFHRFLYDHLLLIIIILAVVAAVTQRDSDVTSLGYAGIAILFSMRYDGLRVNTRIWPSRSYKWWNGELFRILPMYVYLVLASKLVYQIPYVKPMLLNGATARIGACVEGTRLCETINSLFGIRKLGSACDAGMLESDCVPVLSYKSGSIGLDVALFILCSVQAQLFSDEKYVRQVSIFEKSAMDRVARRSLAYRHYVLGWREKVRKETDDEYQSITDKVRAGALQAAEWTRFQKFRKSIDEEMTMDEYRPKNVVVKPLSPTTAEVRWKMSAKTVGVEEFTIMRQRLPQSTIFAHFVNPVKVPVDPESSVTKHVVEDLSPGVSYRFTVQSCSRVSGYGPQSEPSAAVVMPERSGDEEVLTGKDKFINGVIKLFAFVSSYSARFLDPALYPIPERDGGGEWMTKGDFGTSNIFVCVAKIVYSQSEPLLYLALVLNFIDHVDLMSVVLVLFMITFVALFNPQPTPRTWRVVFWYSVTCFYLRLLMRSKIFCMQLRESASVDNRNKWFISAQPLCPRQTLYDPMTDDYFSTLSATLLTVPRARTLVRDEVWSDIFFIAALILHMTRLSSLGQKTKRDIVELMPREDYETYHAKELNLDEKASASLGVDSTKSASKTIASKSVSRKSEDRNDALTKQISKTRSSKSTRAKRRRAFKEKLDQYFRTFGFTTRVFFFVKARFQELERQVALTNTSKNPKRNVGKPGVDLYAMEIFLQLCITLWFVIDYRELVFDSGKALSSTESFGTGLTISILSSMVWIILNRLVYLSQNIRIKFWLHFAQCTLYVVLVFLLLPLTDTRSYMSPRHNIHLRVFTAAILFQFIVSAMQLREGFREGYQFKILIMRFGHTPVGRFLFNATTTIPFLFEIRTLLDWLVCDTSLDFFMWFRYETLFYLLHKTDMLLSWRKNKRVFYTGARPVPWFMKALLGGGTILIIMALLTGPIFIFSTFNPGLTSNRVETATMTVQLDFVAGEKTERHMLYTGFATGYAMTSDAEEAIKKELLTSVTFRRIDSDCVRFPKFSESPWILPSMAKDDVAQILNTTAAANACDATVTMTTSFTRVGPPDVKTVTLNLEAQLTDAQCVQLATVIDDGSGTLQLENIVPRGLHLTPATEVKSLDGQTTNYVGVNMTLDSTPKEVLWRVTPMAHSFPNSDPNFCGIESSESPSRFGVLFATVSDRYLVGLVSSLGLSSYSLRALYVFVFVTIGFAVRSIFNFKLADVFVTEINATDELINVCRGIRLIRSLDYPGKRRDEIKMYHALMRMMRESSLRRVISRRADEL